MTTEQIRQEINKDKYVVFVALIDGCQHCIPIKNNIDQLIAYAKRRQIHLVSLTPNDDNKEFFIQYEVDSFPHAFVFDSGVFSGSTNTGYEQLITLIEMIYEKKISPSTSVG